MFSVLVLHNVMRKFSTSPLLAQMPEKEVMSGWITKVKHYVLPTYAATKTLMVSKR